MREPYSNEDVPVKGDGAYRRADKEPHNPQPWTVLWTLADLVLDFEVAEGE